MGRFEEEDAMPFVEVTLAAGRSPQQLRLLMSRLTRAVVESIGVQPESVRVVLREVPKTHWASGDVTLAEKEGGR
jgi:4-oxalocrotonate tautomerase